MDKKRKKQLEKIRAGLEKQRKKHIQKIEELSGRKDTTKEYWEKEVGRFEDEIEEIDKELDN